jgi:hypothetical protein
MQKIVRLVLAAVNMKADFNIHVAVGKYAAQVQ